jgi:hypothetical protein
MRENESEFLFWMRIKRKDKNDHLSVSHHIFILAFLSVCFVDGGGLKYLLL